MEFGKIFWRVFFIVLLVIVAWWVLKLVLHVAAWLVYATVLALIIAGGIYIFNKLKR
jgi:hypothetical protein